MKWLDRMVSKVHAEPAPFDGAWCAGERRHDMCTGKAVQRHLRPPQGALVHPPDWAQGHVPDLDTRTATLPDTPQRRPTQHGWPDDPAF